MWQPVFFKTRFILILRKMLFYHLTSCLINPAISCISILRIFSFLWRKIFTNPIFKLNCISHKDLLFWYYSDILSLHFFHRVKKQLEKHALCGQLFKLYVIYFLFLKWRKAIHITKQEDETAHVEEGQNIWNN